MKRCIFWGLIMSVVCGEGRGVERNSQCFFIKPKKRWTAEYQKNPQNAPRPFVNESNSLTLKIISVSRVPFTQFSSLNEEGQPPLLTPTSLRNPYQCLSLEKPFL